MPRLPRFPFFPHLAVLATLALCGWLANDSAAGPYLNSAHGNATTGVDRDSLPITYSTGNCAHCHEQHASIGGGPLAPVTGPSDFLLLDNLAGNAACNYCHNGSTGANNNIASQILKASSHDPNSVKVTAPATLWCTDCHESHIAQKVNHVEAGGTGNAILADSPLLEATGVSLNGGWPAAGVPAAGFEVFGVPGLNAPAPLTVIAGSMEYELCFKCHGGQAAYTLVDLRGQFNPNNYSVHPVDNAAWKNLFLLGNPAALNGNWANPANANKKMYCSDCHGSETGGDPQGPHGSTIQYMLKAGGPPAPLNNFDALCLRCHMDPALPGMSSWTDIWGTPVVGDHSYFGHQSMVTNPGAGTNGMGCLACHGDSGGPLISNIHGANYTGNVNNAGTDTGRPSYAFLVSSLITQNYYNTVGGDIPGQRNCATVGTCHTLGAGRVY